MDLEELETLMLQRAWSNRDLAAAVEVTPETISDLYRNASATPALFQKLARKFAEREVADVIDRMAARLRGEAAA